MTKELAVICDIDNTVADNKHREHFLQNGKKDWAAFFSQMAHDTPVEIVAAVIRYLSLTHTIIYVSGRPDSYRQTTLNWLKYVAKLPVLDSCLFMRPSHPNLPTNDRYKADDVLKREIYHSVIRPFYDVVLVLDDRQKVVDMWRKEGLRVWQVAEGNF